MHRGLHVIFSACLLAAFLQLRVGAAQPRILIYSATADFRHDSIPTAIQALESRQVSLNILFENTEDPGAFTDSNLAKYDALLFLHNTGEVLDGNGKAALRRYLNGGGNFVAVHAASDCLRNTALYGKEVGAFFDFHQNLQTATFLVVDANHPSTDMLPLRWTFMEEVYYFKSDPRSVGAHVVLSVNESSYTVTQTPTHNEGTPHPIAWYQEHGAGSSGTAGRSFYTSLGHTNETWENETYIQHVVGGIQWVLLSNTTRSFNASGQVGNAGSKSNTNTSPMSQTPKPSGAFTTMVEYMLTGVMIVVMTTCLLCL